jgi:hypothetical protein
MTTIYNIIRCTNKEPDHNCMMCQGSGQMYATEGSYMRCWCTTDEEEVDENESYATEELAIEAMEKIAMLDKIAGLDCYYDIVEDYI